MGECSLAVPVVRTPDDVIVAIGAVVANLRRDRTGSWVPRELLSAASGRSL